MKQAVVPIVDMATKCVPSFLKIISKANDYLDGDKELCAGGEKEVDACTVSMSTDIYKQYLLVETGDKSGIQYYY